MSSIGAVDVDILRGSPGPAGTQIEAHTRPGTEGVERRKLGTRPAAAALTSLTFIVGEDLAACRASLVTERASQKAIQGTIVAIVDDHGNTHANCTVLEVAPGPGKTILYLGAQAILLTTQWSIEQEPA